MNSTRQPDYSRINRLYEDGTKRLQKRKKLELKKKVEKAEELQECTFTPNLTSPGLRKGTSMALPQSKFAHLIGNKHEDLI